MPLQEVGAAPDLVEEIRAAETAASAEKRLALWLWLGFPPGPGEAGHRSLKTCYPGHLPTTVLVCDFDGKPIVARR